MEKTDAVPLWVFLAFSSIETRKGALILITACLAFTLYSVPWTLLAPQLAWVETTFLIDDWSWVAMMVPITLWYAIALKWVDKNTGWKPGANNDN